MLDCVKHLLLPKLWINGDKTMDWKILMIRDGRKTVHQHTGTLQEACRYADHHCIWVQPTTETIVDRDVRIKLGLRTVVRKSRKTIEESGSNKVHLTKWLLEPNCGVLGSTMSTKERLSQVFISQ